MWYELHKHSQYSMFDGFDKVKNIVAYAKKLGMSALAITDHGNACGLVQLYAECKKQEIKPILGVEAYFQPNFDSEKRRFHLCLFAKNNIGYQNLCTIISKANEHNFYRYGHVTFELLEQYNEGIICSTACIGGFISQAISNRNMQLANKAIKRFKSIFGEDFYFEIQPIKIDELGTQEFVNKSLIELGIKHDIKCVLTTDSHYTEKADFDSYMKMHELSKIGQAKGEGFTLEHVAQTYSERYMHSEEDISQKFLTMHGKGTKYSVTVPNKQLSFMLDTMREIYDKVDVNLDLSDSIPTFEEVENCADEIKKLCIEKLKETKRFNKQYIERTRYELSIIEKQGLCDYFLIVHDYVRWAKENDIYVGPGRGSVGGSLVAELLGITTIDAIEVGTDFERFLRPDKKKMPDVDIDFENGRQKDVIDYIIKKYPGRAAQIITFGYYKSSNLINDLCKVYEIEGDEVRYVKSVIQPHVPEVAHFEFEDIDFDAIMRDKQVRELNRKHKDIVKHFCKLCGQVKYYGKHPAGVLVTKEAISKYVPLANIKGMLICSYDKYDIENQNMLKFDVLALKTLNVIHEIERVTNDKFDRLKVEEATHNEMYRRFSEGATLGIFQLNKPTAQNILKDIKADTIQDIIAAISLNRPGTLKFKTHEMYAANKMEMDKSTPWYPYTQDAYGSVIYQEHVMRICNGLAKMDPNDTDKLMKFKFDSSQREVLKQKFIAGAKLNSGMSVKLATTLFDAMALYMFNKGHGAGYALISEWQMYHKVKNPTEFWLSTIKWEIEERKQAEFMAEAVIDGNIIFLPHVNYTRDFDIRMFECEKVIQMGYSSVKNVGDKAAELIEQERKTKGMFTSYDDFVCRCKSRAVTSRVIEALVNEGALEFDKAIYIARVKKFNSAMYMRANR